MTIRSMPSGESSTPDIARADRWRSSTWLWRTTSTLRCTPLVVVLGALLALANAASVDRSWLDLTAKSTIGVLVVAPAVAAATAWDASRWRALSADAARGAVQPFCLAVTAAAGLAWLTYALTLLVLAISEWPAAGHPAFALLAMSGLVVAAYAGLGFVLGWFLPRLHAVVLSFALVWLWLAYTPTVEPFWIRNITGHLGLSCCGIDVVLAANALTAPTLLATGLVLACTLLLLGRSPGPVTSAAAVVVLVGAVSGAAVLTRNYGPDPVVARSGERTCLPNGEWMLCAWPEHVDRLREAAPVLGKALTGLRAAGMDVPRRVLETAFDTRVTWSFSLNGTTPDVWRVSVAVSPLGGYPPDCVNEPDTEWPAGEAFETVRGWLLVKAGVLAPDDEQLVGEDAAPLRAVLARPKAEQAAWVRTALAEMGRCTRAGSAP